MRCMQLGATDLLSWAPCLTCRESSSVSDRVCMAGSASSTSCTPSDAGPAADGAAQPASSSTRAEAVKAYFTDRGLTVSDIPKAIAVHEGLGLTIYAAAWAGCYAAQPIKHLAAVLPARAAGRVDAAMAAADARVRSWSWLRRVSRDPARLVVGLAESIVLRNVLRPVTIPGKLWLTWKIVAPSAAAAAAAAAVETETETETGGSAQQ